LYQYKKRQNTSVKKKKKTKTIYDDVTATCDANRTGVILAAAFQGFGGSFCTYAGFVAANMALTGREHPDAPPEIFSPNRFAHLSHADRARLASISQGMGYSCHAVEK
jgi:hypothetical protein